MARTAGRRPLPTHLKLVKATRRSRINAAEAVPPRGMPMPPEHLSDLAKVEWGRVCEDLYVARLLTKIDRGILAAYCQAYGRWVQAERALAVMIENARKLNEPSDGLVIRTISGNVINNPLVGVANKAMADMAKYATDLGMTPSSRSRVTPSNPGEADDPAEKYLSMRPARA